ncbi:hypothetical protein Tco_0163870 [Tanacetum coccineum]
MDHECFNLQNDEFEEELKAQRIKDQEFLDTFKELCDSVIKKQREERERIAKEKEAEERSRIDPSLKGFKVFCPTSIYDNFPLIFGTIEIGKEIDTPITPDIPLREETPRYFYDGSMDNGEDIIPLMRISKETGLPEKIIDKSLSESFVSRMNVCQPIPITPDVPILETVNSLKMGEVHFDTSKDSFESSVSRILLQSKRVKRSF